MSPKLGGESARSRVRRLPELADYGHATVYAILDEAPFCHVAFLVDGAPMLLPIIHDRVGDQLYLHGSRSNRMLQAMTGASGACVTATLYDGLVLARSVFNHSMNYRSAVVFGRASLVADPAEKLEALDHLVDHVVPGRRAEARPPNDRELTLTTVVRLPIEEASAKVSSGPPDDEPEDLDYPVWAGVVPSAAVYGEPIEDTHGTAGRHPLPPSVRALLAR